MVDNVQISSGSGTYIAADDISGVYYQRVKLAIGADGEAADLDFGQAEMGNSLPVVLASDHAAIAVSTSDNVVTVTPTCDTSAYAAGDLLFDSTEAASAARANGYTTLLESVTILDKDDQGMAMTLLFASGSTDFGTLNSAPDPDDDECATVLGWVPVLTSDYIDLGGAKVACIRNLGLMLKSASTTQSVYIAGVNGSGSPTYSASGLVFQLGFLR